MRDPYKILGIEPTFNKKQIKKAYAKLAAVYHPEEYPEKWQEIHAAYEEALARASTGGETVPKDFGREKETPDQKETDERRKAEKNFSETVPFREDIGQNGEKIFSEAVLPGEDTEKNGKEKFPEAIPLGEKELEGQGGEGTTSEETQFVDSGKEARFDFEGILSQYEEEKGKEWEKEREELLIFLGPLKTASENEAVLWNVFFQSEVFQRNQFQSVLWEICQGIFTQRKIPEKAFRIVYRQIVLTKQELEEKLQTSGYIPENLEQLDQVLNRTMRALALAREIPVAQKKQQQKEIGKIRKMIYLLVAVFGLLAFFLIPRESENGKTWEQEKKETVDHAILMEETSLEEGEQALLSYLEGKYKGTDIQIPEYDVRSCTTLGWNQTYTGTALWRKGKEEPFAWIWRGKTGEKCFDILQKEEVESAMLAETAAAVGSTEGFAKAEVSEINRIYGKLQVPWLDQLGYHTKYEQNLEKFWQQEKQYRLSEMEDDRPMEAFAGENQNTNYRNDYFVICLKDPTVTTPEGYENVMPAREEEFARYEAAFRQIEEKYHTELEVALYLPEEQMPVTMLYKKGKTSALTGILVTGSEAGKRNENAYELMEEVYERKGGAK